MYPSMFFSAARLVVKALFITACACLPIGASASPTQWHLYSTLVGVGGVDFWGYFGFDPETNTYSIDGPGHFLWAELVPTNQIRFSDADYVDGSPLFLDLAQGSTFLHLSFSAPLFTASQHTFIDLAPDSTLTVGSKRFAIIGDINASAVPEPETYALMLLGLGALVSKRAQVARAGC